MATAKVCIVMGTGTIGHLDIGGGGKEQRPKRCSNLPRAGSAVEAERAIGEAGID